MGTYRQGILGPFSGIVGTVVGANFRGIDMMRGLPKPSSKAPTNSQLEQRRKFATVMQFLTPAKQVLEDYFGSPVGAKSRFNLATSYHIKEATVYVNDEAQMVLNRVVFSKGTLLQPQNLACVPRAGGTLQFTWVNNSEQGNAQLTDVLKVVVYEPVTGLFEFFLEVGLRLDSTATVVLPAYLSGSAINVYAFMAMADGRFATTSQYLGEMRVI